MTDDHRRPAPLDGAEHLDDLDGVPRLDDVLDALAEPVATAPPSALRAELLDALGARPRTGATPVPVTELFARRVDAFAALLDALDAPDWSRHAAPYEWTVHGLVAHLALVEELMVRQAGLTAEAPLPVGHAAHRDHLAFAHEGIAELLASPPAVAVDRWRRAARRVVEHVSSPDFDERSSLPLHEWPFDSATALVVRAFELWTHAEDVGRATGRPVALPGVGELRTMSSAAVAGLPVLLALRGDRLPGPTRLVLTGGGGGTFDLGRTGAEAPVAVLVADVVDYCRLVARRLDPDEIDATRDGDPDFLDALLLAARTIAV